MKIKNVMIAGGGTLGSQIAWQTAFHGFNVIVYDAFEKGLETSKVLHKKYAQLFLNKRGATQKDIDETFSRLSYSLNLKDAVKNANLISESVPEVVEIKKSFYRQLNKVVDDKTIITTNSSTTVPSQYVNEINHPERFLALHFANGIWDANVGEVMGHSTTNLEIYDQVAVFAKNIGMVPILINKEKSGYVLNSLLVPLISAATSLLVDGISDVESIDKTWMISTKTPMGPFGIIDIIGMQTIYNVNMMWGKELGDKSLLAKAKYIKKNYMDKGKMGYNFGEGFYKYPNPKFADSDFLK